MQNLLLYFYVNIVDEASHKGNKNRFGQRPELTLKKGEIQR